MKEKMCVFFFLVMVTCPGNLPADGGEESIFGAIDLIEDRRFSGSSPPMELGLAVDVYFACYYKLEYKDLVVKAGKLLEGINLINFKAGHLLRSDGIHVFILETKREDRIEKRELEIDIRLESDQEDIPAPVIESKPVLKDAVYEVSLFIDDRLVASNLKTHFQKFPMTFTTPAMPKFKYSDPTKNLDLDPLANSFSFFQVAALAVELAKEIKKRTTRKKVIYQYARKKLILADFRRVSSAGQEIKKRLIIRLDVKSPRDKN
jgi:hypothetical protein